MKRRKGIRRTRAAAGACLAVLATAGMLGPATTAVQAQEDTRPLTLETMVDGVRVGDPLFSPDGETILVVSDRSGSSKIWLMDREGGDARMLLPGAAGEERDAAWGPEGERVAFLRGREGGGTDIWIASVEGSDLRRITDDEASERSPAWSPDGGTIAFMSGRAGHQDVWLVDVASGDVRQLTEATNPPDEYRWFPSWSPDGRHIAYVSNRSSRFDDDLWLADVRTGTSERLTTYVQVVSNPVWSPDGEHLAFNTVDRHGLWYHEMSDIHVLDMPERTLRKLDMEVWVSDRFSGYEMAWSPDGASIYFRYEREGDANLWRISPEGGVATKVTYGEGRFGDFSVAGDGRSVAYARSTPIRGDEVHRYDLDGGREVRLTRWTVPYEGIEAPERVTFPSLDGLFILGYLYRPPDFDPFRSYPALVQVHGGGNNAYGHDFHPLEQLLARQGYVVLAIEYRGGAGHGRAFQDLSIGEFAARQGWDPVHAARWLEALPYTNGRVGIYGGSYGGIMTMAGVTRDDRPFDAAAPLYGIYDWADAWDHADRLAKLMILKGHRGFKPGEAPDLYRHTATLEQLDGVRSDLPFLVMHGELDVRAPFQQSERLVEALRARGNPVAFHSYPDERHGFGRPENRVDAYGRLIDFFDRHLKTDRED